MCPQIESILEECKSRNSTIEFTSPKWGKEIISGDPEDKNVRNKIIDYVRDLIYRYDEYYIGITNRPCERPREHLYDNTHEEYASSNKVNWTFDKVAIVYQSENIEHVRKVEQILQNKFPGGKHDSKKSGVGKIGQGCQYVYVLLKKKDRNENASNTSTSSSKSSSEFDFWGMLGKLFVGAIEAMADAQQKKQKTFSNSSRPSYTIDDAMKEAEEIVKEVEDFFDDKDKKKK